jgi:hypothetical protein
MLGVAWHVRGDDEALSWHMIVDQNGRSDARWIGMRGGRADWRMRMEFCNRYSVHIFILFLSAPCQCGGCLPKGKIEIVS